MCRNVFDPRHPASHCRCRPPEAETLSVEDQINFARAAGFRGGLHICHVSAAASVALIKAVRAEIKITCGVTPHHLLWDNTRMNNREGLLYKVNPPLRELSDCIALRRALKAGDIDWIETDHAPHPLSEKLYPPYLSGYPSLCLYGDLVDNVLPLWGLDENLIKAVTCGNIKKTFMEGES
jgi:dihydroorotase